MKLILIWIAASLCIGVGGGLYYLNRPAAVTARVEHTLANATPNPSAKLVRKSFTNGGHKFSLLFFSDGLVDKGALAAKAGQEQILARPGHTPTSFVVFAGPLSDAQDAQRSDCATQQGAVLEFTVSVQGQKVGVCRPDGDPPYHVYVMDIRSTGTWEKIILFVNDIANLQPNDAQLKTILSSLVIQ